jgi:hypothetical protein
VFARSATIDACQVNPESVDPRDHITSITYAFRRVCRNPGAPHATSHALRQMLICYARCGDSRLLHHGYDRASYETFLHAVPRDRPRGAVGGVQAVDR